MKGAKLSQFECRDAVETTIYKSVEYPMEAVTLTEKQWQSIMWPLWKTMLPKMGINRYFPKELHYAPMKFSGLGFKDPYHWQFLKQMQSFIREWERPSITNQLLHGVIEQQIVELGFQPAKGEL